MIRSVLLISSLLFSISLQAQQLQALLTGNESDSSFYDIARIDQNRFWAGGENGILKEINQEGIVTDIPLPYRDINILKIVRSGDYVFLAADKGTIIRYDLNTGKVIRSNFSKKFQKKCFYDMLALEDGTLIVAGGNQKIAKAGKSIPHGFIARLDPQLAFDPEISWEHPLFFAWSILEPQNDLSGEYFAVVYNGIHSTLLSSANEGQSWQKKQNIKGLVHDISWRDDRIWLAGSKNFFFHKNGWIRDMTGEEVFFVQEGCIWSMLTVGEATYALAYNGALISLDMANQTYGSKDRPSQTPLYEAVAIDGERALIAGHGRQLYLLDTSFIRQAGR